MPAQAKSARTRIWLRVSPGPLDVSAGAGCCDAPPRRELIYFATPYTTVGYAGSTTAFYRLSTAIEPGRAGPNHVGPFPHRLRALTID